MSIAGAYMGTIRSLNEDEFDDTYRITRKAKEGDAEYVDTSVMDPDTLQYPTQGRITVYEGPGRLQLRSTAVGIGFSDQDAGDRRVVVQEPELQLPVDDTADVTVNDVAECLTAPNDDSLVGRKFTVMARHEKTHAGKRRLRVSEVIA